MPNQELLIQLRGNDGLLLPFRRATVAVFPVHVFWAPYTPIPAKRSSSAVVNGISMPPQPLRRHICKGECTNSMGFPQIGCSPLKVYTNSRNAGHLQHAGEAEAAGAREQQAALAVPSQYNQGALSSLLEKRQHRLRGCGTPTRSRSRGPAICERSDPPGKGRTAQSLPMVTALEHQQPAGHDLVFWDLDREPQASPRTTPP